MMNSNTQLHLSNAKLGREFQTSTGDCHPRKISVGILTDSFSQPRPKDFTLQIEENATSPRRANSAKDGKNIQEVVPVYKLKQSEPPERETSPLLSSRSFHKKLPVSEQFHGAEPTPTLLATEPTTETHNRVRAAKDGTAVGVEKISFATMRSMPEEDVEEQQTTKAEETRGSDTLRMKLWEILGTIASPNKQHASEHDLNMEAKTMTLLQSNDGGRVPVVKPRQNSDTIETDSECPDLLVGRPVTRSLIRKKAAGRLKARKMETAQSTDFKKAKRGVSNNSFLKEGLPGRLHYAVTGASITFTRKRSERWSPGIKARIMCSDELENPGRNQPVKSAGKRRPSWEKSRLQGNAGKDNNGFHRRRDGGFIEPKSVALEIDSLQAHLKDVDDHLGNIVYTPKLQESVEEADQKLDNHCPTFGVKVPKESYFPDSAPSKMKNPVEESSPVSPQKTKLWGADDDSPANVLPNTKGIQSLKSFLSSRSNYVKSDSEPNSSGYAGRLENSPPTKPMPLVAEEPECRLSLSSSEGSGSETSKAGSQAKVIEAGSKLQPQLDSNEGDGLASVFSLFAFALERVKSRMKSMVRKRSAAILTSVAEGIQLQLQIAESRIQADMVKLTSINKSKRKRLDMRYEELQGQLNVIHARFKDEVNRHLQDCRSIVEGLDAHHMELRGTLEKQSVSHRKLLLQAEEAIETHLNDAQRRITEVHDLAREKMFQLKSVVADCLQDGNFS